MKNYLTIIKSKLITAVIIIAITILILSAVKFIKTILPIQDNSKTKPIQSTIITQTTENSNIQ